MTLNDTALEALAAQHQDRKLHKLTAETGHEVVVRLPNREEWKRFRAQMNNEHRKMDAPENLLFSCMVWPERPAFEALLDERPGLVETFASALLSLSGASSEVEKKAL